MNINFNNLRHPPKLGAKLPPLKFRESSLFAMQWQWAKQGQKIVGALATQRQRKAVRTTRSKPMKEDKWRFGWQFNETVVKEYCKRLVESEIREKLCLVQEVVPNSKPLAEGLYELELAGLTEEEVSARFDQKDFEDANLLLWITGHRSNFLIYPKSHDAIGHEILGIKQIANSLAFPEKNERMHNPLSCLPNANQPLSFEGKTKIAALSLEELCGTLIQFRLENSVDAFRERLALLKELADQSGITIRQIDTQMSWLSKLQYPEKSMILRSVARAALLPGPF